MFTLKPKNLTLSLSVNTKFDLQSNWTWGIQVGYFRRMLFTTCLQLFCTFLVKYINFTFKYRKYVYYVLLCLNHYLNGLDIYLQLDILGTKASGSWPECYGHQKKTSTIVSLLMIQIPNVKCFKNVCCIVFRVVLFGLVQIICFHNFRSYIKIIIEPFS